MYIKLIVLMLFCFQARAASLGSVIISDENSEHVIEIVSVRVFDSETNNVALIAKPGSKYNAVIIYLRKHLEDDYDLDLATRLSGGFGFVIKLHPENLKLVTQTFHTILEVKSKDVLIKSPDSSEEYETLYEYVCPVEKRRALWLLGKTEYRHVKCL